MGIASMTGFGRGEASVNGVIATVEISSVNRKQLDCNVTLPPHLNSLEPQIQSAVRSRLSRGYVRVTTTLNQEASSVDSTNIDLWQQQITTLRQAAAKLNLPDDLTASTLLRLDAANIHNIPLDAAWEAIEPALTAALNELSAMRHQEGTTISTDLIQRLETLQQIKAAIAQRAPTVPLLWRDTLQTRLTSLLEGQATVPDPDSLAREVALFADRCDISEELTRLASHFDQTLTMLNGSDPCGRPLDFICQELFREINTIGSKANDATITRHVIAFKTALETLREQVQNLE
ncbi:MAG: YicC family protein [Lentisphaerae bacterium]|nr:YicC family protein [Lentisphaerota bacterium]